MNRNSLPFRLLRHCERVVSLILEQTKISRTSGESGNDLMVAGCLAMEPEVGESLKWPSYGRVLFLERLAWVAFNTPN